MWNENAFWTLTPHNTDRLVCVRWWERNQQNFNIHEFLSSFQVQRLKRCNISILLYSYTCVWCVFPSLFSRYVFKMEYIWTKFGFVQITSELFEFKGKWKWVFYWNLFYRQFNCLKHMFSLSFIFSFCLQFQQKKKRIKRNL